MSVTRLLEDPRASELSEAEIAALPREVREVYARLPEMLPAEKIASANSYTKLKGGSYEYRGMRFEIPAGVLIPGGTSEVLFDAVEDGTVDVEGKTVAVMGCGAGVEIAVAARRGAREVLGFDIHEASIAAARGNVEKHLDPAGLARCRLAVSDLFAAMPDGSKADVILFNPPANPIASDDPDLARVNFSGSAIMFRFFEEITARRLLTPDGRILTVLSNANNIKGIVASAIRRGLRPEILRVKTWPEPYEAILTHLLAFSPPRVQSGSADAMNGAD